MPRLQHLGFCFSSSFWKCREICLFQFEILFFLKGEKDIDGLTNKIVPRRLGPKRANKIRKLFNLSKTDDVRKYVVRRPLKQKEG